MIKKQTNVSALEGDAIVFGFYVLDGQAYHTVFDDELQAPVTETLSREQILESIEDDLYYLGHADEYEFDAEDIADFQANIAEANSLLDQIA